MGPFPGYPNIAWPEVFGLGLGYFIPFMRPLLAGIESHHELGANWESAGDWVKWLEQCQVTAVEGAQIMHSLW